MALSLGKLTILIGAGLVGSVLAKEGRLPSVSDVFSGPLKIAFRGAKKDDNTTTSRAKPHNDTLMAQVDSLRQELQILASNRPVTIVTSAGSGSRKYGVIIIVAAAGYGYIWWKGWKLPDMMFATKRSLSDATNAVAKQLETVYSSISAAKRHLSSRIDRLDCSLDECAELTAATKGEVSQLRGETKVFAIDVQSVHNAVNSLETKLSRIEVKQDATTKGVEKLIRMESQLFVEQIQAAPSSSSRPALVSPQTTPVRVSSLPPVSIEELPASPPGSPKVRRSSRNDFSASGLKALHGEDSEAVESPIIASVSNGVHNSEDGDSSTRRFGLNLLNVFSRTRSSVRP